MSDLTPLGIPTGVRIPGGCEHCHAYQVLDATHAPIYRLGVHHDPTCPQHGATRTDTPTPKRSTP